MYALDKLEVTNQRLNWPED